MRFLGGLLCVQALAICGADRPALDVSTYGDDKDVVRAGTVAPDWQRGSLVNQSCSEYQHEFVARGPDYVYNRNSTGLTVSPGEVARGGRLDRPRVD